MSSNKEIGEGKIYAVLGYLSLLCFIPLLFKKENKFVLFHAKQGFLLFLSSLVLFGFKALFLTRILGNIGLWAVFIFSLVGIFQSLMGNRWKMPVLGDLAGKIDL